MYMNTTVCIPQIPAKYEYVSCMFWQVFSNLFLGRTYFTYTSRVSYERKLEEYKIEIKQDLKNCLRYSEQTYLIAKDHDVPTKSRIQNKREKWVIPRQRRQILYKSVFYKISAENKQNIELILY